MTNTDKRIRLQLYQPITKARVKPMENAGIEVCFLCPEPGDLKNFRLWLKLCPLNPWPNTWGCFFIFQKFWFFGPGDKFFAKRRLKPTDFKNVCIWLKFYTLVPWVDLLGLEWKSEAGVKVSSLLQSKSLLPNTKYLKFYNWAE